MRAVSEKCKFCGKKVDFNILTGKSKDKDNVSFDLAGRIFHLSCWKKRGGAAVRCHHLGIEKCDCVKIATIKHPIHL